MDCVAEHAFVRRLQGRLSADERQAQDEHISRCEECRELLTALVMMESSGPGGSETLDELTTEREAGRYVVLDVLGRGAMGEVCLAYDPELDRRIAVKFVHPARAESQEARVRLLREARALARVDSRFVPTVHDVGVLGGDVFIAMEFIEGTVLGVWQAERDPDVRSIVSVFAQAGRGLSAAHRAGIVHRDFKPDNVLVETDGAGLVTRTCVVDFGLARAGLGSELESSDNALSASDSASSVTRTGATVGTPAYLAPEQYRGETPTPASDQFSFCVALYEALYGERPFAGSTIVALQEAISQGVLRPRSSRRRVPERLRSAVLRGLAAQPGDRWPSMESLLSVLEGLERRRTRARWATAGLAVTALGVTVWISNRPQCEDADAEAREAWNEGEAQEFRERLGMLGPNSEATVSRAVASLDDWVENFAVQQTQRCEAGEPESPSVRDEWKSACHQRQLASLRSIVNTTPQTPAEAWTLLEAVDGLESPEQCLSPPPAYDLRTPLPPPDVQRAFERGVAEARLAVDLGRVNHLDETLAELDDLVDRHAIPAWSRRVQQLRGAVALTRKHHEDAADHFETAMEESIRADAPGDALRAINGLLAARGYWLADERAEALLPVGRAFLDRVSDNRLRSQFHYSESLVHRRAERPAKTVEACTRGLAEIESGPLRWGLLICKGTEARNAGEMDKARALYEEVDRDILATYGPEHPHRANVTNFLGIVHFNAGRYEQARDNWTQSLEIVKAAHGPEHLNVAHYLSNLAAAHGRLGQRDQQMQMLEEALRIIEANHSPTHRDVGQMCSLIGQLHLEAGRREAARPWLERSIEILEAAGAKQALVQAKSGLGMALLESEPQLACDHIEGAYTLREDPALTPDTGRSLDLDLAACELTRGHKNRALELTGSVRAALEQASASDPSQRARADMLHARVLLERGSAEDRAEAITLLRATVERLEGLEHDGLGQLAKAQTLLAEATSSGVVD